MSGCKTCPKDDAKITLPPKPERSELKTPETTKDLVGMIAYYEFLVQDWELWGKTVEELVNGESNN